MKKCLSLKVLRSLSYFLIIKVKKDAHRMYLNQIKYVEELRRKTGIQSYKEFSTPMSTSDKFTKDIGSEFNDKTLYKSLIGAL